MRRVLFGFCLLLIIGAAVHFVSTSHHSMMMFV